MTAVPTPERDDEGSARGDAGSTRADDRSLWADAVPPPFEDLVTSHGVELYRYLRRLAPSADDAADLHQDTFLRAFRAYPRLAAGANVRAWLYRIAGNLARDAHRRRAVRSAIGSGSLDLLVDVAADSTRDPGTHAAAAETRRAVQEALLELTARQRVAVIRRVLEGDDYADVADALGCTEPTARQHVSQGLRRLRQLLAQRMELDP
ncbi:MAG: RNA polymerase sigma factor [Candidatus Limnocylindrales bacterium]